MQLPLRHSVEVQAKCERTTKYERTPEYERTTWHGGRRVPRLTANRRHRQPTADLKQHELFCRLAQRQAAIAADRILHRRLPGHVPPLVPPQRRKQRLQHQVDEIPCPRAVPACPGAHRVCGHEHCLTWSHMLSDPGGGRRRLVRHLRGRVDL